MQVKDVMTRNVISVQNDDQVLKAARLMLQNRISGLPVLDKDGELVGIVTEGDFLRRSELGTQRRRSKWLEFIVGPGKLAEEYVHAAGRKVEEIMTPDPCVVGEDDTLEKVVELMERRRVKRLPVVRAGRMVGIVSRANLMHALASLARDVQPEAGPDWSIRNQILTALGSQHWAPNINVVVKNGVAEIVGLHHRRPRAAGHHRRGRERRRRQTGARSPGLGRADVGDGFSLARGRGQGACRGALTVG